FILAAPIVLSKERRTRRGELDRLATLGFSRFFNTSTLAIEQVEDFEEAPIDSNGRLILALDRFSNRNIKTQRLLDSIEQAFSLVDSVWFIEQGDARRTFVTVSNNPTQTNQAAEKFAYHEFHKTFRCASSSLKIEPPRPALFSFNHPIGACPECKGFGKVLTISPELVVPDPSLTIRQKAVHCWSGDAAKGAHQRLLKFCQNNGIGLDIAWRDLTEAQRETIFNYNGRDYSGINAWFRRKERKIYKMHVRMFLSRYRTQIPCPVCNGARLREAALAYKVKLKTLPDIWKLPIFELRQWIAELERDTRQSSKIYFKVADIFCFITAKLEYLCALGLGYLTLDRQARTLSGGETQRVNLATAVGSELVSAQFVLDEPSVGLHPRDTARLLDAIRHLQSRGNSVLMVEHDLECIRAADSILELGPLAGEYGGKLVYSGPAKKWNDSFSTKQRLDLASSAEGNIRSSDRYLEIRRACARNLKQIDLKIPLDKFICLTGVSGSGKSTLVSEVIMRSYERYKSDIPQSETNFTSGFEQLDQVSFIDQTPLAKTPRANIATYSGVWEHVRKLLSETDDAKSSALSKSAFSFNVEGGRCPQCKGAGFVREDMQFLSDVYIPCEVCLGKRFQSSVLNVRYKQQNVDDFLNMSVATFGALLSEIPQVKSVTETLVTLGLGHLRLGHSLSELSGGEAQRLKLVPYLSANLKERSLLIFDEPTTGLHWRDLQKLLELLRLLVDSGHTVICIEHNPILILASDWIIDLGPEGGAAGGDLVLEGTPLDFLKNNSSSSHTAIYLQKFVSDKQSNSESVPASKRRPRTK
ncbi:MAG: ATP-binding cassette domain-containing protein, partial [Bdellovibrionales bacterium]|nr:ATP-binding cassette domain-containing protein [Bdellovibrionales bacterium]